jgi:hypothetical protein
MLHLLNGWFPVRSFKHMTNAADDEKLSKLVDLCGLEGYGFWWRLLEIVGAHVDWRNEPSVSYSVSKWCSLFGIHHHKFRKLIQAGADCGLYELLDDTPTIQQGYSDGSRAAPPSYSDATHLPHTGYSGTTQPVPDGYPGASSELPAGHVGDTQSVPDRYPGPTATLPHGHSGTNQPIPDGYLDSTSELSLGYADRTQPVPDGHPRFTAEPLCGYLGVCRTLSIYFL